VSEGAERIAVERERQITDEGYTAEHDKGHSPELALAAYAYVQQATIRLRNPETNPESFLHPADIGAWPWKRADFNDTEDPVKLLTMAGALIAAAIDDLVDTCKDEHPAGKGETDAE
jgi:hypothetical protein